MRINVLPVLLLFSVFISAIACSNSDNSKKFKVGAILPLTGHSAEYGVAARNGIELAKIERPELFKNIEFTS